MDLLRRRRPPVARHHARRARERDRLGRGDRRLDERRPPPARDRARARHPAHDRRLRPDRRRARPSSPSLKPGGRFVATDVYEAGGVALVARELVKRGPRPRRRAQRRRPLARRDRGGGRGAARPGGRRPDRDAAQADGRARRSCYGNLAPEGCVVKLAGHERLLHRGPARVFDSEEACFAAVKARRHPAPATSSSSATRARPAAPGCARCCTSPPRSSARGSATRSRSSPTAASRARRTA